MAKHNEFIILGIVAVIAVLALVLLYKMPQTGYGIYSGGAEPGRAAGVLVQERLVVPPSTQGVPVSYQLRKGALPEFASEPCPPGYKLSEYATFGCREPAAADYYVGVMCCPFSSK